MKKYYLLLVAAVVASTSFAQVSGTTWQLAPQAGALAVGPAMGDFSWWSNSADDVTTRACLFDDVFAFYPNGEFKNIMGTETWVEPWQGLDPENCATPVAPHDGSNEATWSYDADAGTITLTGVGAHLGLSKVYNGAECTSPADAPASITYLIDISGDMMTLDIDFNIGFWHFVLVRTTTGLEELQQGLLFNLYPNPANSEITINSSEQVEQVVIYDVTGKQVMTEMNLMPNETINVSSLTRGLYMVEARSGNKRSAKRLVLN